MISPLIVCSFLKVPELSEPGFVIGTLSAEDPDNSVREVQKFVYSLVEDVRGQVEVKGNQLQASLSDYEISYLL